MQNNNPGILYVVATPIGNLQDITARAIETLRSVDRIIAEDTRHSAFLLNHFSVQKPTLSMHEFNEHERVGQILNYLKKGESVALISDAGTPLISDPGFNLVREARIQGIKIVPIPGACAAITALSVAGLPTNRFVFEGFLPSKEDARCHRLTELVNETRTLIFYESPHRLLFTIENMAQIFGADRQAVIGRELTKKYEMIIANYLAALAAGIRLQPFMQKGEMVILVAGQQQVNIDTRKVLPEKVLSILLEELPLKQAVMLTSKITNERKNILYEMALSKRKD